jgi:hypothetical protein
MGLQEKQVLKEIQAHLADQWDLRELLDIQDLKETQAHLADQWEILVLQDLQDLQDQRELF